MTDQPRPVTDQPQPVGPAGPPDRGWVCWQAQGGYWIWVAWLDREERTGAAEDKEAAMEAARAARLELVESAAATVRREANERLDRAIRDASDRAL